MFVFLIVHVQAQCSLFIGPNLGNDTILCSGNSLQFDLSGLQNNPSIVWENGTTNPIRTVTNAGVYSVETKYLSNNLVINGDFEQGNTGFLTDYIVGTGGSWGLLS